MAQFETVIGLEVHAQLDTDSKIFATSAVASGDNPNSHTDPVTLGLPGCLPVLNKRVVDFAIKAGLATNCSIEKESVFARKHYHYPDLPKGYQISQYDKPICLGGYLDVKTDEGVKKIGITRIHLEEDAGKSTHLETEDSSLVDLNRAGIPLVEIVSEPDMRTPQEAGAYVRQLRQIVKYLGICDGDMEKGNLRCDVNVSVRPIGQEEFGTKVEVKNVNSFRFVERAIEYEQQRQIAQIEQGEEIVQETRLWDEQRGSTKPMRSKEFAEDYRYFPDPDLPPVIVDELWVKKVKESLPELPDQVISRFKDLYQLEDYQAERLTEEKIVANYFDKAVSRHNNPQIIANWICTELFGRLNKEGIEFEECPVSPAYLAELVELIDKNVISGKIAKTVFDEMFQSGQDAASIVEKQGLKQITDTGEIEKVVSEIIAANPEQVEELKSGKEKVLGFFVGQVMKATKGKANPQMVNDLIKKLTNG